MVCVMNHTQYRVLYLHPTGWEGFLWKGLAEYASTNDAWLLSTFKPFQQQSKNDVLKSIKEFQPNGIIASAAFNAIEEVLQLDVPVIIHRDCNKEVDGCPVILGNNSEIGSCGAEYFINLGYKKFAFCGNSDSVIFQERAQGFSRQIEKSGFNAEIFLGPRNNLDYSELTSFLKSLSKFTGVMAGEDSIAADIISCCREANISIPYEICLIGVNNEEEICETQNPKLSSISLDHYRSGIQAAELLNRFLTGKEKIAEQEIHVYPIEVVQRRSSDSMAFEDIIVSEAVKFIKNNSTKNIQVIDVADHVAISRSMLNQKFRKELDRSIAEYIRQVRTREIAKLLLDTNLSISQIARLMNFNDSKHISRYFKQALSLTPLEYRKNRRI